MKKSEKNELNQRIELKDVSVAFDDRTALTDVTVELDADRIGVIGLNGSGKSTFARLLDALVAPTTGTVRVHGLDAVDDAREVRRRTGFIFADPQAQILRPTVSEDVAFSLRRRGLSKAEIRDRVQKNLERFRLTGHADAPAHSLSGGQQQMLAVCSVLVTEPGLLIADEPTGKLDARNRAEIAQLLLEDIDQQLVLVTHDLPLARRCDVVLHFEEGRLKAVGEPDRIVDAYEGQFA